MRNSVLVSRQPRSRRANQRQSQIHKEQDQSKQKTQYPEKPGNDDPAQCFWVRRIPTSDPNCEDSEQKREQREQHKMRMAECTTPVIGRKLLCRIVQNRKIDAG